MIFFFLLYFLGGGGGYLGIQYFSKPQVTYKLRDFVSTIGQVKDVYLKNDC